MHTPLIELFTFEGCPHAESARRLVDRVTAELGLEVELRRIDVVDAEAARRHRFLGSPTIRVDGRDIEPGADRRDDFVLACRVYRTPAGPSGEPESRWLRAALEAAARR